jgi:hypothetical protein
MLAPGGYVGVDVFFVISGYLITGLIVKDIERGRFSIHRSTSGAQADPSRSVRRPPGDARLGIVLSRRRSSELGRLTAATAGFVSNIAFWMDTGYFDSAAESKPLLHTVAVGGRAVLRGLADLLPVRSTAVAHRAGSADRRVVRHAICLTMRHQPTAFFLLPHAPGSCWRAPRWRWDWCRPSRKPPAQPRRGGGRRHPR